MIQTSCPLCQTSFKLPDTQLGKRVRCKSCKGTFLVKDEGEAAPVLEEASAEELQEILNRPTTLVEELPVLEDVGDEPKRSAVRQAPVSAPPPAPPPRRRHEDDRPVRRERDDDYRGRPGRRDRDDDYRDDPRDRDMDRDRERGSGGGSMLLIIGACVALLLLLAVGGGLAFYFASSPDKKDSQASNTNPGDQGAGNPFGNPAGGDPAGGNPAGGNPPDDKTKPPDPPPAPVIPEPKDIDAALAMLKDGKADARRVALKWLERAPAADRALNRAAVGKAIKPLLTDGEVGKDAFNTAVAWRCPQCIPQLAEKLADNSGDWMSALKPLSEIQDEEAAELLAKQLGVRGRNFWVREPLKQAGKRAEKFVIKYLHDPDFGVRRDASEILKYYGTSSAVILEQTITDLESSEKETRKSALGTVGTLKVAKEQQAKAAKAVEGFMSDTNVFHRRKAMKVLNDLATEDNLTTIHNTLNDTDTAIRETALIIIARIKSEQSIEPLALHLTSPKKEQTAIANLLVGYGSKAEKAVQLQLTHINGNTRGVACLILAEIGTKDSLEVLRKFGLADKLNFKVAVAARQKIMLREKEKAKMEKDKPKE